ncbi:MAG TPA: DNA cytosine methyltransferase, partial [Phenylobacterium sp.]
MAQQLLEIDYTHAHLFGGVGGGAMGFNRATARLGRLAGRLRCLGSIDVDAAACRAFERNVGAPATAMDLFDYEQYVAWHGRPPPAGWREATPADLRRAFQNRRPDLGFLSAPCKGFSGLLPESTSRLPKYEALNRLTLRGVWLWLEAFQDDPTPLIFFENVPLILARGRGLLDQIAGLFQAYGYAWAETT